MTVAIKQSDCERNNPFTSTNHVKSYKSAFLTELFSIDLKTEAKSRTSQRPVTKLEREKFWYPQKIWPLVWGKMLRNMPSFVAFFLRSRNHRLKTTQYTFISPLSAPFPILCGKKRRRETNRKRPSNLCIYLWFGQWIRSFSTFFLAEPFPHQLKPNHTSARKTTAREKTRPTRRHKRINARGGEIHCAIRGGRERETEEPGSEGGDVPRGTGSSWLGIRWLHKKMP